MKDLLPYKEVSDDLFLSKLNENRIHSFLRSFKTGVDKNITHLRSECYDLISIGNNQYNIVDFNSITDYKEEAFKLSYYFNLLKRDLGDDYSNYSLKDFLYAFLVSKNIAEDTNLNLEIALEYSKEFLNVNGYSDDDIKKALVLEKTFIKIFDILNYMPICSHKCFNRLNTYSVLLVTASPLSFLFSLHLLFTPSNLFLYLGLFGVTLTISSSLFLMKKIHKDRKLLNLLESNSK